MEEKKMSVKVSAIIITILVIIVIMIGAFCAYLYLKTKDIINNPNYNNEQLDNSTNNTQQEQQNENNSQTNTNNTNTITNTENNISQEPNESTNPTPSTEPVSGTQSSIESPLAFEQWGIASTYSGGQYVNTPAKVDSITRGAEAAKQVKEYCDSGSTIYKYTEPKEGMEWAIIDYTVDLTNVESYYSGKPISLTAAIKGLDGNSIKYNNTIYIVSTMDMSEDYSKENIAKARFATNLPIGCTDYLIILGSSSSTQAYFHGK